MTINATTLLGLGMYYGKQFEIEQKNNELQRISKDELSVIIEELKSELTSNNLIDLQIVIKDVLSGYKINPTITIPIRINQIEQEIRKYFEIRIRANSDQISEWKRIYSFTAFEHQIHNQFIKDSYELFSRELQAVLANALNEENLSIILNQIKDEYKYKIQYQKKKQLIA